MLQRDSNPTQSHSFVMTVELEDGRVNPEQVSLKLADALTWVEGVGHVDVDYMGTTEWGALEGAECP